MLFLMDDSHELISNALETNKAHQSALVAYAQALAAEIHEIDKLLVSTLVFSIHMVISYTSLSDGRHANARKLRRQLP